MNYMADIIRDCSKTRPITFNDISFPITQEIQAKIRNKNISLRKKGRNRLNERQKVSKGDENKQETFLTAKKEINISNKSEKQQLNFLDVYQEIKPPKENRQFDTQIQLGRLDQKDQETTFQIYLMLKKNKPIFKIEEVRRKIKGKQIKKNNLKECECCQKLGKHKCAHTRCQKKCQKLNKKSQKAELLEENEEPESAIAIADQLIEAQNLQAPEIAVVQIKVMEQEMVMPRIDVIDTEEAIKKEGELSQCDLPAVVETQRISQIQSNSHISESKKNKSQWKQKQEIAEQKIEKDHQQKIQIQIEFQNIKQDSLIDQVKEEIGAEPQGDKIEQLQQQMKEQKEYDIQPIQKKLQFIKEQPIQKHSDKSKYQLQQIIPQPEDPPKQTNIKQQQKEEYNNHVEEKSMENIQQNKQQVL